MVTRANRKLARRDARMRALALVFLAALVGTVVILAFGRPSVHGDSGQVIRGASGIVDCLRHGRLVHCDGFVVRHRTGDSVVSVQPFALLQYVPAIPLRAMGVSKEWTARVFLLLNAASLVAIIVLAYTTLRRLAAPLWAPLVTVILIASPLLWYGRVKLSEELASRGSCRSSARAWLNRSSMIGSNAFSISDTRSGVV